jgi:hypothetical protein
MLETVLSSHSVSLRYANLDNLQMAYVLQAWLPLIVWQQVDAPNYQKGFITITFLSALLIATAFTVRFLWKRELLRSVIFDRTLFLAF